MDLQILARCEALVLGGGLAAMSCALTLAARNIPVLLCAPGTSLYEEISETGDLRIPEGVSSMGRHLFPAAVQTDDAAALHADRLKRHGEDVLRAAGVQLLYACQVIDAHAPVAQVAHKSGLYGVQCRHVYDLRTRKALAQPACCLHLCEVGVWRQMCLPTAHPGRDAAAQHRRLAEAWQHLPRGAKLGRSGHAPTELLGLDAEGEIQRGMQAMLCEASPAPSAQESYDVIVVGGGTAGAAAAIFAARQGLRTLLLEMNPILGGTATCGGVSAYWFGLREGATAQIDQAVQAVYDQLGMPRKPGLWNDHDAFLPDIKAHALLGLCLEAGVEVRFSCIAYGVMREEGRVTGVRYAWEGRNCTAHAPMTLDCTGDGDLCVHAGADVTYGAAEDGMTFWASLAQFNGPDTYRNNFSNMVRVDDPIDYTRFILAGRRRGEGMVDHGGYVAVRESRHVRGLACVTLRNVLAMAPCDDPLYVCFSNSDPKGRMTADVAYFGFLPPNQRIAAPRGAVIPVRADGTPIPGLLVGGKAICCERDVFPALRMQPDLQSQGLALAALAGQSIRQGVHAWQAAQVQETILSLGGTMPEVPCAKALPLAEVIAALRGDEPWHDLDMPLTHCAQAPSAISRVMLAKAAEAVPLLREALGRAEAPALRLTLSRLLLWHGDDAGAPEVIRAIEAEMAACTGLPRRRDSINYGQLLPDHGLMPECVYLLCSLSRASLAVDAAAVFRPVAARLLAADRDWKDLRAGVYCYADAVAYTAKARRDGAFIPLLREVLTLPEFAVPCADELLQERFHMLHLLVLAALHTLGDRTGAEGLAGFLDHERRAIALAAKQLLDMR